MADIAKKYAEVPIPGPLTGRNCWIRLILQKLGLPAPSVQPWERQNSSSNSESEDMEAEDEELDDSFDWDRDW